VKRTLGLSAVVIAFGVAIVLIEMLRVWPAQVGLVLGLLVLFVPPVLLMRGVMKGDSNRVVGIWNRRRRRRLGMSRLATVAESGQWRTTERKIPVRSKIDLGTKVAVRAEWRSKEDEEEEVAK